MTNTPAVSLHIDLPAARQGESVRGSEMAMMADGAAMMRGIARYGTATIAARSEKA
jgi:hypothetical protein